jgi:hypothetical protein
MNDIVLARDNDPCDQVDEYPASTDTQEVPEIIRAAVVKLVAFRLGMPDWWSEEGNGAFGQKRDIDFPKSPMLMHVHHCWSGYSEYTITSTWDEITIEWGDWKYRWDGMATFFRQLEEAERYFDDRYQT